MSASVVTPTIDKIDNTQSLIHVYGSLAVGAGDYAADGLAVSFLGLVIASDPPLSVEISSQPLVADATTGQYVYGWAKGTTQANGKMQIFTGAAAQSPLTELSDGATPAAVVADRIRFHAVFNRL